MALTKNDAVIVASQSNAAGGVIRGAVDLSTANGGIVTMKITNGASGPTAQCRCSVMISHDDALPATGPAGAAWKTVWSFGGGVTSNAVTEQSFTFGPEIRHLQIEFTGNAGQAVTVESALSFYTV